MLWDSNFWESIVINILSGVFLGFLGLSGFGISKIIISKTSIVNQDNKNPIVPVYRNNNNLEFHNSTTGNPVIPKDFQEYTYIKIIKPKDDDKRNN